ncbi:uncharacterized protein N7515_004635 [Penicillium bovifimosum]|uniref:LysM domain-containing protein n=1 Tax=Penicillium bovifimosum TaxID=126998 RepID=A0A9W9H0G8_9EURO|nr:uncharacterized protein N7515_004635 [Penicillium bovifimosum]KAJ5135357.1 hypothetical protein N7515_004635 [Penicillium bovifimosum]
MILSRAFTLALLGLANAATLRKRFSNGDFATGDTDPNVTSGCTYWANSISSTDTCTALESFYGITTAQLVSWKDDYCYAVVTSYGNFTLDQFYTWNPAVKNDCSGLQPGYYVCVGVSGSTATTTTSRTTTAAPTATTTSAYSPQQSGIASNCDRYYFVESGNTCAVIAADYGITLSNFYAWNPAVCYLFLLPASLLTPSAHRHPPATTATTKATTTTTKSITTATTGTGPSPTQAGIVADCSTYYQARDGDSCWSIVNEKYTYLTQAQFYAWNPAIGSSCSNLQLGYYYCVATKDVGPMPNTVSNCAKWHLVASGDSCWSIEQQYSITAAQFGNWNPYIGSSCASLWLGYYVCVGV